MWHKGRRVSERESERQKSGKKEICSRVGAEPQREKGRERAGNELSVRCKSKQEVNKANELGTPSLAKGRSESAAKGQQSVRASEWVSERVSERASKRCPWVSYFPVIFRQPVECVARLPPQLQLQLPLPPATSPLSSTLNGQLIAGTRLKNRTIKNAAKKQQLNWTQVKNSYAEPFLKNSQRKERKKNKSRQHFCASFLYAFSTALEATFADWLLNGFISIFMARTWGTTVSDREGVRVWGSEGELMLKRTVWRLQHVFVFILRLGRPRTRPRRDGMLICWTGNYRGNFRKWKLQWHRADFMGSSLPLYALSSLPLLLLCIMLRKTQRKMLQQFPPD